MAFARTLAYSPDGRSVLSGSDDRTIRIWDVESGHERQLFENHTGVVLAAAFSPNSQTVLSSARHGNGEFIHWNSDTGEVLGRLGRTGYGSSVAFLPNGRLFVTGDAGPRGFITFWNATSYEGVSVLGAESPVSSIAVMADGIRVLSGHEDRLVRLWNWRTKKLLRTFNGHFSTVSDLSISPDEELLASAAHDQTVRVWSIATGEQLHRFAGHTDIVTSVDFSNDGNRILSASWDGTIRIWDVLKGQETHRHEAGTALNTARFSPDGSLIAAGGDDGIVYLWRLAERSPASSTSTTSIETSANEAPAVPGPEVEASQPVEPVATEILTSAQWTWAEPGNLREVNSDHHESSPYITPDGLILMFSSTRPGGYGDWDIWMSERVSTSAPWGHPTNLGRAINEYGAGGAFITVDGLTLYFHSARPNGIGGNDIWMSTRPARESVWETPANLGPAINDEGDDGFPQLSSDGLTLYFASGRMRDVGTTNLWASRRTDLNSEWGTPVNIGTDVDAFVVFQNPEVTADQLTVLFSEQINGRDSPHILWMANRSTLDEPFGHRRLLGGPLSSWATSADPTITEDGSYMIFRSNHRGSNGWDLWWTHRVPK